ncbi:MAG: YCF48-related protein [Georgfuchsia sp.]
MRRILDLLISGLPLVIVSGLLYAGLFIKPQPHGSAVAQPVFERGEGIYGLSAFAQRKVWAVGSNGKIAVTENGGESWQRQDSGIEVALQDISSWDEQRAVAVGNDGVVVVTSDAGRSWQTIEVPKSKIANKLLRVKAQAGGTAWAVGEAGMILRSTDYGKTWLRMGAEEDAGWNDVVATAGKVWLVGEFGRIKVSDDDGVSWRVVTSSIKTSLMSVAFKDGNSGLAVGLGGVILATRDGGQKWVQQQSPTSDHLYSVLWDGTRWLATGASGTILVGDGDGRDWKATRLSPLDRNWYTSITRQGDKYFLSGSKLAVTAITAL